MTSRDPPSVLVVMGVCGSGKTSVAEALHDKLNWPLVEADEYHSQANKDKMKAGIPLTDSDRQDWLLNLHGVIKRFCAGNSNGVVTCSALKRKYRQILTQGNGSCADQHLSVTFVYLKGSEQVLYDRLTERKGHYMPASLLKSQLDILEEPSEDESHIMIDINQSITDMIGDIMTKLRL